MAAAHQEVKDWPDIREICAKTELQRKTETEDNLLLVAGTEQILAALREDDRDCLRELGVGCVTVTNGSEKLPLFLIPEVVVGLEEGFKNGYTPTPRDEAILFYTQKLSEQSSRDAAEEGPRSPIANGPEIFAAKLNERAQHIGQLHNDIQEIFQQRKAERSYVAPNVFDVDCSCITDFRETDMIMEILKVVHCVYMKAQPEEQKLFPGRPTMAHSLELMMNVLELNIQNSKTLGLKTYEESEMQPIFKEIYNYFNIDINFELQTNPESFAAPQDYFGLNGCFLSNIMTVLEKLAMILKNIYLSRAAGDPYSTQRRNDVPTDKQRIEKEYRTIFGRIRMSLDQYALCARVCGQLPDEDICGDGPMPYDQKKESLTFGILGNVIDVYTPLLVKDMKDEMKFNKKAAEVKKNRQIMREQRMQKDLAAEAAAAEASAAAAAEAEAEEKRVAAQKKAAREAAAAEQQRRSREGAQRKARELSAAPPTPDTTEAAKLRKQASAQRKEAETAEKTRKHLARKRLEEAGARKKQKKNKGNASDTE